MNLNYYVLNNSIVLNYNGKLVNLSKDDSRYETVLNLIREDRLEEIPEVVETERLWEGHGVTLIDGIVHVNGVGLPTELSSRILAFKEQRLPFEPLLKFWENLSQNPSFNARKMLYKFLEHNGHPLTSDGCFIAYRGVSEDFKDIHSKSYDNNPGNVCTIAREAVDDNPNNTCSTGLHVACYSYAKGFGPKLIEVKVNPMDVVAVPTDYNGTKMRVCKFEVIQEIENEYDKDTHLVDYDDEDEMECPHKDYYTSIHGMYICCACGEEAL